MSLNAAVRRLTQKFTSGNEISVTRATITREEWDAILPVLQDRLDEAKGQRTLAKIERLVDQAGEE